MLDAIIKTIYLSPLATFRASATLFYHNMLNMLQCILTGHADLFPLQLFMTLLLFYSGVLINVKFNETKLVTYK